MAIALSQAERCRLSVVSPSATKHFQKACGVRAKTDRVDAHSLREYAVRMEFVPWTTPDASHLEFRALVRYSQQLTKDKARLLGASSCQPASRQRRRSGFESSCSSESRRLKGNSRLSTANSNALRSSTSQSTSTLTDSTSIPGIGRITARRLVADFLMLDPTMTSSQITAWAGLDPRPNESGTTVNGRRPISKRGSSRVRAALYMSALTAARMPGPHKDLYDPSTDALGQEEDRHRRGDAQAAHCQLGDASNQDRLGACSSVTATQESRPGSHQEIDRNSVIVVADAAASWQRLGS